MIHDFKDKQTVYLMDGGKLWTGVVEDFKDPETPLEDRHYVPVRWGEGQGGGSPLHTSLRHNRVVAILDWYEIEKEKLNKRLERLLK